MALLSAFEDFVVRTLGTLAGPRSRLAYIGSLRRDGKYGHWGLERAYGDSVAADTISDAHTEVWLEVLRTPLRKLVEEPADATSASDEMANLVQQERALTPSNLGGGSKRHFSSVLLALSLLCRKAKQKNPPAA